MLPTREQFDTDLRNFDEPTEYPIDENIFVMPCAICRNEYYVDREMLRKLNRAAGNDDEYTFLCHACEAEYDELEHQ